MPVMSMNIDFTNKTAVVFGAGRGIGQSIALEFAKAGATVYIADLLLDNCKKVKEELVALGYKAEALAVDVSNYERVDSVLEKAEKDTGCLDFVINNAGIVTLGSFLDTTPEEIDRLIKVNLLGANNGCQAGIKRMKKYNSGKIVNTSSFAGRRALKAGFAHYGMTKAGVIYLTQAAAYAGADYNINVNSVCPGIIRSAMWESILDSYENSGLDRETSWKESLKTFIPLARGDQKPEDIAYTVMYLCSPYANHITGQAINVDGGASMD
jgi:NAD(P)-dependent dehydrogenase (short-subunit alcohol dehydrogenase family)